MAMSLVLRHHLSAAEKRVLDLLDQVREDFAALPAGHEQDRAEVERHVHAIRKVVAARIAYRSDSDRFPTGGDAGAPTQAHEHAPHGRHAARPV